MRASAFLQRAAGHKDKLKESVGELVKLIPDSSNLVNAFDEAKSQPVLASSIFRRILEESGQRESQFRRTQYRHGLYQYALLAAAQDALKATELLPNYALSWLKAGEILSELWKLEESTQYFERAMELDPSLVDVVTPVIKRLRKRQQLLKNARGYGWSDSTLRLALDATG
jgi:tetratricopeptide (TPR) repeat protein